MYLLDPKPFPVDKKAYLVYGTPAGLSIVLKKHFPKAVEVDSVQMLGSSGGGVVIVTEEYAEEALEYVALPKTDRTYLFILDHTTKIFDQVKAKFSSWRLPQIDCTDPSTPTTKRHAAEFVETHTKLKSPDAWIVCNRANWELSKIIQFVFLWRSLVSTTAIGETQQNNVIDTILPPERERVAVLSILSQKWHKVDLFRLDTVRVFELLSEMLSNIRILHTVLPEKSESVLIQKTGLTATDLKWYVPLAQSVSKKTMKEWSDIYIWCWNRKDKPHILHTLVAMMAGSHA